MVYRVYVEKKPGFDVEAKHLRDELRDVLGVPNLNDIRVVNRYDAEGISEELFERCIPCVFSEPQSDNVYHKLDDFAQEIGFSEDNDDSALAKSDSLFAVEYLPGQFDQRAESASECVQLISAGERPTIRSAKIYVLSGEQDNPLSVEEIKRIKKYIINPIEAREASLDLPDTLHIKHPEPKNVETLRGFCNMSQGELNKFIEQRGLAMDLADITFCQKYFANTEHRDPTITEIKMIDTYWSDHCRHTTFGTVLDNVEIENEMAQVAFERYLELRHKLERDNKPICLMDMATIGAKYLQHKGILKNLDESDEINACTVKVKVDVDGTQEDWLYLFKNETHNHPTEVEPFGGAATCIGGAIRDPLSGRAYVYQAMRVTGAGDPTVPISETLPGKLPQRKIVTEAAAGYSSYGNQIGIATGQVCELYHPGFAAKRMEIGAVVAATPANHVKRETPSPGDAIILLGGRTGRDGIGGATGSSKAHTASSIEACGAEVQKGNAPVERKLQRLFRRGEACKLIKRCNDFGAGGVSVATGEIADGLIINLDKVPKKYEGLDGTELAISESQERMACAVAQEDVEEFLGYAESENLEATVIAEVSAEPRLKMTWQGNTIVDISREFLNSNGAPKHTNVRVCAGKPYVTPWQDVNNKASIHSPLASPKSNSVSQQEKEVFEQNPAQTPRSFSERMFDLVANSNIASNKGLSERFDSTIGAGTVLMPHGGKHQLTPACAMVSKLPVEGETSTVSGMSWGYNPHLSSASQFAGAYIAVLESVCKLVATGFRKENTYLTFQEYFGKLRDDPKRWGMPVNSLLGALMAQLDLGVGAIGGKDSMSGSFDDLDVPPTLVSFATALGDVDNIVSPEFKGTDNRIAIIEPEIPAMRKNGGAIDCAQKNAQTQKGERVRKDAQTHETARAQNSARTQEDALIPDPKSMNSTIKLVEDLISNGSALSVNTIGAGGAAEAIFKMCIGNGIGAHLDCVPNTELMFAPLYGAFIVELSDDAVIEESNTQAGIHVMGKTINEYKLEIKNSRASQNTKKSESKKNNKTISIDLGELQDVWENTLEGVFPYKNVRNSDGHNSDKRNSNKRNFDNSETNNGKIADTKCSNSVETVAYTQGLNTHKPAILTAKPRVIIPVFPGNNCEYDSERAFVRAGANVHTLIINNLTPLAVTQSIEKLVQEIEKSHIIMIPGGFSGGDEPDGSAKFITAFFRNPAVTCAVRNLLQKRNGLILGICNGFQALIKLGLVPFGDIIPMTDDCPTLTFNTIGRHMSKLVHTRVASNMSPWLAKCEVGDVHTVAISHGEGRFVASEKTINKLKEAGQIAFQYTDAKGAPCMDLDVNPNGSVLAIEGITSPNGQVLGKMGHTERSGAGLYKNIPDTTHQPIIESGVNWFK